jgi:hypothetical protein
MYYFIYVLWFVFLVAVNSDMPLNNSTYCLFLSLFTKYAMHEIMNPSMFTFPYIFPSCWFAYG